MPKKWTNIIWIWVNIIIDMLPNMSIWNCYSPHHGTRKIFKETKLRGSSTFAPKFRAYFQWWFAKKPHMILRNGFPYFISTVFDFKKLRQNNCFFEISTLKRPWLRLRKNVTVDFMARFRHSSFLKQKNEKIKHVTVKEIFKNFILGNFFRLIITTAFCWNFQRWWGICINK